MNPDESMQVNTFFDLLSKGEVPEEELRGGAAGEFAQVITLNKEAAGLNGSLTFTPCVGSGYCCKQAPCWEAKRAHGEDCPTPCPELVLDKEADRHWCGLVLKAEGEEETRLKRSLDIGFGCCSTLNTDRIPGLIELIEKRKEEARERENKEGRDAKGG